MDEITMTQASSGAANSATASESALAWRSGEVYVALLRASQLTQDVDAQDAMTSAVDLITSYWRHQQAADLRVAMEAIHDGLLGLLSEILAARHASSGQ